MRVVRLVKKAKKGNKGALLQLISEQQDAYYRLALTYMGNSHDAMDAMEDMIVSLYHSIPQLKKEDAFYSWSKTILVNRCKKLLQKKNKIVPMENTNESFEKPIITTDATNSFTQTEQRMDLKDMLSTLNANQQEAIELKYLHDLDLQTIADMTNVSIGTVKSRIFQGLKKMREQFGGEWNE
ncbi:RNA polymerase sigma factor [Sporosarcina aquimarina]|uniref:sigma-70 family RNA polymerase sigma factor n=1 Tax=Sporosarcina aquimarina TaxID=114975 RepID=UPI0020426132|nr:RNA polymerase sigma factor [Sporosarcina aquimarina]MCM3758562.1 RNA polymerase sigma factor [Sporosarcina aquimarina]